MQLENNDEVKKYFQKALSDTAKLVWGWNIYELREDYKELFESVYKKIYSNKSVKKSPPLYKDNVARLIQFIKEEENFIEKHEVLLAQAWAYAEENPKLFKGWRKEQREYLKGHFCYELFVRLLLKSIGSDNEKKNFLLENEKKCLPKEKVIVYCQSRYGNSESNSFDYVLDLFSYQNTEDLVRFFTGDDGYDVIDNRSSGSLVRLKEIKSVKNKYMREGCWYSFNRDELKKQLLFENLRIAETDSGLFCLSVTQNSNVGKNEIDFNKYQMKVSPIVNVTSYLDNFKSNSSFHYKKRGCAVPSAELTVYDVGCGNCVYVQRNAHSISKKPALERTFIDFGADEKVPEVNSKQTINAFKILNHIIPHKKKFSVILTHWDADHVRLFKDLVDKNTNKIKKLPNLFKSIVAPALIPSTKTNELIFTAMTRSLKKTNIMLLAFPPKRSKELKLFGNYKNINIYLAPLPLVSNKSCDQNNRGIVVTIEGKDKIALLPGDHSYNHVMNNVIEKELESKICSSLDHPEISKPLVFVIPHHGGRAGRRVAKKWNAINYSDIVLSTRAGAYRNVPLEKHYNYFKKIADQQKICFHSTDRNVFVSNHSNTKPTTQNITHNDYTTTLG